jgi:NADH-quinone oxidoreductase subunit E
MLSAADKQELTTIIGHAEHPRAACVDAMNFVQSKHGWVSDEHLRELAGLLQMSPTELDSVATFYNLIFRRKVGRHVILVCDSISCWIVGSEGVFSHLKATLGIVPGQTTEDGEFTLLPVPCLGACHRAPAMMVDDELHVNLTGEKIDAILGQIRSGQGSQADA